MRAPLCCALASTPPREARGGDPGSPPPPREARVGGPGSPPRHAKRASGAPGLRRKELVLFFAYPALAFGSQARLRTVPGYYRSSLAGLEYRGGGLVPVCSGTLI